MTPSARAISWRQPAAAGRAARGINPSKCIRARGLHVLRVDPDSGEVLACRLDDRKLVRLSPDGLEVEATTYHGR